ncbi:putative repeat protein (TIGR01451 family) [Arcicella aurantiaca]|uniref:Putative repeat protein (TIGR01451 family) n=1 Tax=Arcicella aurantiaca TaxID=591202 RepID=A0A316DJ44_9BACT|nr:DUF11 domain-containing protein [Arcicella aurantiaca]PWK17628.1 putative repeat protein (TIGR01451 family) [Arcicella aurantiaca]
MKTITEKIKPSRIKHDIGYLFWSIMMGFVLTISSPTFSQNRLECNYKAGTFNMTLTGHTTGIGFSSRLVLTDNNGTIKYVTPVNSTTFQNVLAGNYLAYGITYENALYVPNLDVGKNINLVSACYKTVVVPTNICDCNNSTGNFTSLAINIAIGKTVSYALTDGKGKILLIKMNPTFEGNPDGVYNIIPITYQEGTYPLNFEIGKDISLITGINMTIEKATGFVACLPQKPILDITKNAPNAAVVENAFNYTLTIKNIGNTATQDIITVTDTLQQGLTFQKTVSSDSWNCQSNIVIVNNSTRTLVTCQSSNVIIPNDSQTIIFSVVAQKTGLFINQAFANGGGSIGYSSSNKVQTVVKDKTDCKEICVPFTVIKKTKKSF